MKKLTFSFLLLAIGLLFYSFTSIDNKQEQLTAIRKEFQRIEHAELTVKHAHFFNPDDAHDQTQYRGYYEGDQLVKLSAQGGESMFSWHVTYYLKDDALFFIYDIEQEYLEDDTVFETQSRFYLHAGTILEALIKEGDVDIDHAANKPHPVLSKDLAEEFQTLQEGFAYNLARFQSVE